MAEAEASNTEEVLGHRAAREHRQQARALHRHALSPRLALPKGSATSRCPRSRPQVRASQPPWVQQGLPAPAPSPAPALAPAAEGGDLPAADADAARALVGEWVGLPSTLLAETPAGMLYVRPAAAAAVCCSRGSNPRPAG